MAPHLIDRRHFALGAGLMLSGCVGSGGSASDTAGTVVAGLANRLFSSETGPDQPPKVPRQAVLDMPYASMGVEAGDGPQAMFLLAAVNGADTLWTLGYRFTIVTRAGRIVRTKGFSGDPEGASWAGEDGARIAARARGPAQMTRQIELRMARLETYQVKSRFVFEGEDTVTIIETPFTAVRVREIAEAPELGWSFENLFWVDPGTGFFWRSIQHTHPSVSPLTMEIFRPPG